MIPRFKPHLGKEEFLALFFPPREAVSRFETEFAKAFEVRHAVAFPYGRSALWAFFKCMGLKGVEIIIPAYTCSVVAHAIVLSGNIPRFIDVNLNDYNMNLDLLEEAINERTGAVIPTHLFGYPLDIDRLDQIIAVAESRYGNKIWVIQDCAHAFGAQWRGKLVCHSGDGAIFGLNISKLITSIFGGMLTTNDASLADRLRIWRDRHFRTANGIKTIRRQLYLLGVYVAFHERIYGLVNFLEKKTPLLNSLVRAYHLDEKIHFPPGHDEKITAVEASVGIAQLEKYQMIIHKRIENAHYYFQKLRGIKSVVLPPLIDGATYSHFTIRVPDKAFIMKFFLHKGIEIGDLIQYSLPHMNVYRKYVAENAKYPNSLLCSQSAINLPVYKRLPISLLLEFAGVVASKTRVDS